MEKKELKSDKIISYIVKIIAFLTANSIIVGSICGVLLVIGIVSAIITSKNNDKKLQDAQDFSIGIYGLNNDEINFENIDKLKDGEIKYILTISYYLNNDLSKLKTFLVEVDQKDFSTNMTKGYYNLAKAVCASTKEEKDEFFNLSISLCESYDAKFHNTCHYIDYLLEQGHIIEAKELFDSVDYQDNLSGGQIQEYDKYKGIINQLHNQK